MKDNAFKLLICIAVTIIMCTEIIIIVITSKTPHHYDDETTKIISENGYAGDYFTKINYWSDSLANYYIVYANDTKVKYLIITSSHKFSITPLYNADGSLQIYEKGD